MKTIVPEYYPDFSCIADLCRHSCCKGWEIDIDAESLARYREIPGEMGKELRENIIDDGETAQFRLSEEERCPFLNERGLCRLILNLGEESLCQICTDHPRFRNFFSDRTEIGLGLCCEAACHLILNRKNPVKLITLQEGGASERLTEAETEVLAVREKLFGILQDRTKPLKERIRQVKTLLDVPEEYDWKREGKKLLELERMDEDWTALLTELRENPHPKSVPENSEWDTASEQLLHYLLYRHLPKAEDGYEAGMIARRMLYIWELARVLCAADAEKRHKKPQISDFEEVCRLLSSELEYSEENMDALIWDWEEREENDD